jgi:predicted metalloendopeptidase
MYSCNCSDARKVRLNHETSQTNNDATLQTSFDALLSFRIDNNVDPCNNFYDFACGNFIQESYTPDETSAVDTFTKLKESIDTQVYMMMLNDAKDEEANANLKLSQELFKTCLERNRESC